MLLAIPLMIAGFFYGLALTLVVLIAWFALLFTGRWPQGMYDFVAGALRFTARTNAYFLLAVDRYPPFGLAPDNAYPARLRMASPLDHYSRLKVLFRAIYVIPAYIAAYILGLVGYLIALASWVIIVVTGRQPAGLQNATVFCLSYTIRAYALMYLLTETYPPFDSAPGLPASPATA